MSRINNSKTLQDIIDYTDVYDIRNGKYYNTVDHLVVNTTTALQKFYPYIKEYISAYTVTKE